MRPSPLRPETLLADVRRLAVDTGRAVIGSARAGDARAAIDALGSFRLLCGHRRGPEGVATWMDTIENWLRADVEGFTTGADLVRGPPAHRDGERLRARPLQRRHGRGDRIATTGGWWPPSSGGGTIAEVSPTRLAAVDTVYAMTVHKSQGSQYEAVAFLRARAPTRGCSRASCSTRR